MWTVSSGKRVSETDYTARQSKREFPNSEKATKTTKPFYSIN